MENTIRLLKIERKCVSRNCDRDCAKCDLVQDRDELLAAFDKAIDTLEKRKPIPPKWYTFEDDLTGEEYKIPMCGLCKQNVTDAIFCPYCGKAVKWE